MDNPKVSVIVTCYNQELYIKECIKSINSQSYDNIELLVYNDGSRDDSEQVIKKTIEHLNNDVQYFSQENQGVAATRNRGLARATGDFLLFVDGDDFLEKNYILELIKLANKEKLDITYCPLYDFIHDKILFENDYEFSYSKMLLGRNRISVTSLIKRSIVEETRFDSQLKVLEDWDFFVNLILKGARVGFTNTTKLNYRILDYSRNDVSSADKYRQRLHSILYILKKYRMQYPKTLYLKGMLIFSLRLLKMRFR